MASAKDIIDDFTEDKVTLGNLINDVSEFLYDERRYLPMLKKLRICQTHFWMKKADFDKAKENLERQPMLLVAGMDSLMYNCKKICIIFMYGALYRSIC